MIWSAFGPWTNSNLTAPPSKASPPAFIRCPKRTSAGSRRIAELLRAGGTVGVGPQSGLAPVGRRETDEMKPARSAGFLAPEARWGWGLNPGLPRGGAGAKPPQSAGRDEASEAGFLL